MTTHSFHMQGHAGLADSGGGEDGSWKSRAASSIVEKVSHNSKRLLLGNV